MGFEHGRGSPSRMDLGLGGEQGAHLGGLLVNSKLATGYTSQILLNDDVCAPKEHAVVRHEIAAGELIN